MMGQKYYNYSTGHDMSDRSPYLGVWRVYEYLHWEFEFWVNSSLKDSDAFGTIGLYCASCDRVLRLLPSVETFLLKDRPH